MPAKSEKQRRLMAMARAYKRGELKDASEEVKRIAASMTDEELTDFMHKEASYNPLLATAATGVYGMLRKQAGPFDGIIQHPASQLAMRQFGNFYQNVPERIRRQRATDAVFGYAKGGGQFDLDKYNAVVDTARGAFRPSATQDAVVDSETIVGNGDNVDERISMVTPGTYGSPTSQLAGSLVGNSNVPQRTYPEGTPAQHTLKVRNEGIEEDTIKPMPKPQPQPQSGAGSRMQSAPVRSPQRPQQRPATRVEPMPGPQQRIPHSRQQQSAIQKKADDKKPVDIRTFADKWPVESAIRGFAKRSTPQGAAVKESIAKETANTPVAGWADPNAEMYRRDAFANYIAEKGYPRALRWNLESARDMAAAPNRKEQYVASDVGREGPENEKLMERNKREIPGLKPGDETHDYVQRQLDKDAYRRWAVEAYEDLRTKYPRSPDFAIKQLEEKSKDFATIIRELIRTGQITAGANQPSLTKAAAVKPMSAIQKQAALVKQAAQECSRKAARSAAKSHRNDLVSKLKGGGVSKEAESSRWAGDYRTDKEMLASPVNTTGDPMKGKSPAFEMFRARAVSGENPVSATARELPGAAVETVRDAFGMLLDSLKKKKAVAAIRKKGEEYVPTEYSIIDQAVSRMHRDAVHHKVASESNAAAALAIANHIRNSHV